MGSAPAPLGARRTTSDTAAGLRKRRHGKRLGTPPQVQGGPWGGVQDPNSRTHFAQRGGRERPRAAHGPQFPSVEISQSCRDTELGAALGVPAGAALGLKPREIPPSSTSWDSGNGCPARRELRRDRSLLSLRESFDPAATHQLPRGGYAQPEPGSALCFTAEPESTGRAAGAAGLHPGKGFPHTQVAHRHRSLHLCRCVQYKFGELLDVQPGLTPRLTPLWISQGPTAPRILPSPPGPPVPLPSPPVRRSSG